MCQYCHHHHGSLHFITEHNLTELSMSSHQRSLQYSHRDAINSLHCWEQVSSWLGHHPYSMYVHSRICSNSCNSADAKKLLINYAQLSMKHKDRYVLDETSSVISPHKFILLQLCPKSHLFVKVISSPNLYPLSIWFQTSVNILFRPLSIYFSDLCGLGQVLCRPLLTHSDYAIFRMTVYVLWTIT